MASISVGIPVRNESSTIGLAIQSVLDQTRPVDELLVFDNGSADGTDRIAAGLLGEAGVRRSDENLGAVANFNRAALGTSGDYFAWLGGDDLLDPDYVRRTEEVLEHDPAVEACAVFVDFFHDFDGPRWPYLHDPALNSDDLRTRVRSFIRHERGGEVYALYRRAALLRSPMFVDSIGGDLRLSWWFVLRGTLRVIEEPLIALRRVPDRDRTPQGHQAALNPKATLRRRPRIGLWRDLWRDAGRPGIPRRTTRIARAELWKAIFDWPWSYHFSDEILGTTWRLRIGRALRRLHLR